MTLTVRSVAVDDDRALLDLAPDDRALLWSTGGEGLVAWGEAARLDVGRGPERFARAERALTELAAGAHVSDEVDLPGSGLIAFGSFTFADGGDGSVLVVPRVVRGRRDGRAFATTIDPDGAEPVTTAPRVEAAGARGDRPRFAGSSQPDHRWLEAVDAATRRIRSGALDKVVLARDHALWSEEPFDVHDVAVRLAARFPSCHVFHVDGLVGATPELLLRRRDDRVVSRVLAGTAPRGATAAEDGELGLGLLASAKERAEHDLAVASVTDVLGPRCDGLEVDGPALLALDNVQHLATTVRGRLHDPASDTSLALVGALHPTAAVGGSPRSAALALIGELEGMDRGRYAAPVGWTDADGDGEWGIALRCAEVSGARARLFAGAGVVAASRPEEELAETRLKLAAMRGVLDDEGPR